MLSDITLGQYVHADSPVHKMDPRVKIVLTIAYLIFVFLVDRLFGYVYLAAYLALAVWLSKVPFGKVLRSIKPLLFIMVFTLVLNVFFVQAGETLVQWRFIHITTGGLRQAVFMALRLTFLVTGTSIMTLTTSPVALTDGLEKLFAPLKIFRFPAHELAMMMTIALRFIPTLLDEANKIMKAQMARGADFESGNVFVRARAMIPVLVPLFVSAFRRAEELAMAMESRCYHGDEGRTRMKVMRIQARDFVAMGSMMVLGAFVVLLG